MKRYQNLHILRVIHLFKNIIFHISNRQMIQKFENYCICEASTQTMEQAPLKEINIWQYLLKSPMHLSFDSEIPPHVI